MFATPGRLVVIISASAALALSGCTSPSKKTTAQKTAAQSSTASSSTATRTTASAKSGPLAKSGPSTKASAKSGTNASTGPPATTNKTNPAPTATPAQKTSPAQRATPAVDPKAAWGDVTLGAIRINPKLGTPSAQITITNHSAKRSNYIIDLSITSADGKIIDAAMVAAPGIAPGRTANLPAQFRTMTKLPAGAKLTIVGVARLAR